MTPSGSRALAVELAVQDPAGVRVALEAGADRVELCTALETGGLTPSIGVVEACVETAALAGRPGYVHVLVRPRGGGFVYTAEELATSLRDVRALAGTGVGGVVVGALTADGQIDAEAVRSLAGAAGELQLTFHRALDAARDPVAAFDGLAGLGVSRVLSSGGAERSIDGRETLAVLCARSGGIEIMAGGGVRVEDVPALAAAGVAAVHLSARRSVADPAPAGPGGGAARVDTTDLTIARAAVRAARAVADG